MGTYTMTKVLPLLLLAASAVVLFFQLFFFTTTAEQVIGTAVGIVIYAMTVLACGRYAISLL